MPNSALVFVLLVDGCSDHGLEPVGTMPPTSVMPSRDSNSRHNEKGEHNQ